MKKNNNALRISESKRLLSAARSRIISQEMVDESLRRVLSIKEDVDVSRVSKQIVRESSRKHFTQKMIMDHFESFSA
jgi:hypothetical protein